MWVSTAASLDNPVLYLIALSSTSGEGQILDMKRAAAHILGLVSDIQKRIMIWEIEFDYPQVQSQLSKLDRQLPVKNMRGIPPR